MNSNCILNKMVFGPVMALCAVFFFVMSLGSCTSTQAVSENETVVSAAAFGVASVISHPIKDLQTQKSLPKVYVTNKKAVHLLSPMYMKGVEDTFYSFRGTFGLETFHCIIYNQSDANGISLLVSNEFGLDMGSLLFRDGELSFTSTYFPKEFRPEYIVADFQNASYDEEALAKNYEKAGLSFSIKEEGDGSIRRILSDKDVVEEVTVLPSSFVVKNPLRGYSYILTKIQ